MMIFWLFYFTLIHLVTASESDSIDSLEWRFSCTDQTCPEGLCRLYDPYSATFWPIDADLEWNDESTNYMRCIPKKLLMKNAPCLEFTRDDEFFHGVCSPSLMCDPICVSLIIGNALPASLALNLLGADSKCRCIDREPFSISNIDPMPDISLDATEQDQLEAAMETIVALGIDEISAEEMDMLLSADWSDLLPNLKTADLIRPRAPAGGRCGKHFSKKCGQGDCGHLVVDLNLDGRSTYEYVDAMTYEGTDAFCIVDTDYFVDQAERNSCMDHGHPTVFATCSPGYYCYPETPMIPLHFEDWDETGWAWKPCLTPWEHEHMRITPAPVVTPQPTTTTDSVLTTTTDSVLTTTTDSSVTSTTDSSVTSTTDSSVTSTTDSSVTTTIDFSFDVTFSTSTTRPPPAPRNVEDEFQPDEFVSGVAVGSLLSLACAFGLFLLLRCQMKIGKNIPCLPAYRVVSVNLADIESGQAEVEDDDDVDLQDLGLYEVPYSIDEDFRFNIIAPVSTRPLPMYDDGSYVRASDQFSLLRDPRNPLSTVTATGQAVSEPPVYPVNQFISIPANDTFPTTAVVLDADRNTFKSTTKSKSTKGNQKLKMANKTKSRSKKLKHASSLKLPDADEDILKPKHIASPDRTTANDDALSSSDSDDWVPVVDWTHSLVERRRLMEQARWGSSMGPLVVSDRRISPISSSLAVPMDLIQRSGLYYNGRNAANQAVPSSIEDAAHLPIGGSILCDSDDEDLQQLYY